MRKMKLTNLILLICLIATANSLANPPKNLTSAACTFRASYTPYYTQTFINLYLADFHKSVQAKTGCNLLITTNNNDDEYLARLLNNDYTVTIIPESLLDIVREVKTQVLLKYMNPKNGFRSIIIAKKQTTNKHDIYILKDQLILTPGKFSSSHTFLKQEMSAVGIFNKEFINSSHSHEQLITKLLNNEAKFGSINTLAFNQLSKKLQSEFVIIKQSEPVVNYIVTPDSTSPAIIQAIIDSAPLIKAGPWVKP
jgi:ABC-type phosphate/phosphonate transport system substrate-binding protein